LQSQHLNKKQKNDHIKKNIPKYITLNDYLSELQKKTLGQRLNILIEIIKKIQFLHNSERYHGNIHGDLIVYQEYRWLIMEDKNDEEEKYPAPECLKNLSIKNWRSDIFQLGFIVFEFMVCTLPWANLTPKECALKIKSGYRPDWCGTVNHFPHDFLQLINQCWEEEPLKRPNCQAILTVLQDLAKAQGASIVPQVSNVPLNRDDSDSDDDGQEIGHQRFTLKPPQ